jgi:hypothetical protein
MEPITMLYLGTALANLVNGELSREATTDLEDKRQEFQESLENQRQEFQRNQLEKQKELQLELAERNRKIQLELAEKQRQTQLVKCQLPCRKRRLLWRVRLAKIRAG